MASWGTLGPGWQYAAGGATDARMPPKLFEAFGGDTSGWAAAREGSAFSRLGGSAGLPGSGGIAADATASAVEDEVPRVFSMKDSFNQGLQNGFFQRGLSDFNNMGECSQQTLGMGGAVPSGDPCWVTVFGWTGQQAAVVRQQLEALCGPVVEVRHGDGNFMHMRFHSASNASKCLAHNGRPLLGGVLIGCVPCAATPPCAASGMFGDEADLPSLGGMLGGLGGRGGGSLGGSCMPPVSSFSWNQLAGTQLAGAPPMYPWRASSRGPQAQRGGMLHWLLDLLFDM